MLLVHTHRGEGNRLAVFCGRAGRAATTHYDQDMYPFENHIALLVHTHIREGKRLAVPCARADSTANAHYDQDILTSAIGWKPISRFPFNVNIGFRRRVCDNTRCDAVAIG